MNLTNILVLLSTTDTKQLALVNTVKEMLITGEEYNVYENSASVTLIEVGILDDNSAPLYVVRIENEEITIVKNEVTKQESKTMVTCVERLLNDTIVIEVVMIGHKVRCFGDITTLQNYVRELILNGIDKVTVKNMYSKVLPLVTIAEEKNKVLTDILGDLF